MTQPATSKFYRKFQLSQARAHVAPTLPAAHQAEALGKLTKWFEAPSRPKGAVLVLPTGGGKTFTAVRFLCTGPLSRGYKVLWLAHTHHLLEQAFHGFGPPEGQERRGFEAGRIAPPREHLHVRVVSGTEGHSPINKVSASDDVVIGTLQTIARAHADPKQKGWRAFLRSTGGRLLVVFDEAHHAPAASYRRLLEGLRDTLPELALLGLTATPTHTDERKRGWLAKLFPQGIVYQVSPQRLMAQKILAKPLPEVVATDHTPEFDEKLYHDWLRTHRDLPEQIVEQLARRQERNDLIADVYARNREKYGRTIIFADRWYQCEYLRAALEKRGVRAGAVYSHVESRGATAEERNRRSRTANHETLDAFREGRLDVIVNVRMLTEGTDVPQVNSVFLTRPTTSRILLTQMVGRALRGSKFGGTDEAHIVSFFDRWQQSIPWATWDELPGGEVDENADEPATAARPPLQLLSIDLIARLARDADAGVTPDATFLSRLPVGWYRVEYDAAGDGDETEAASDLVLVFDDEQAAFERFVAHLLAEDLSAFADAALPGDAAARAEAWRARFFPEAREERVREVLAMARHVGQSGEAPTFFPFEARDAHDLDELARRFTFELELPMLELHRRLKAEYADDGKYWRTLYPTYELFKAQFDACTNRLLFSLDRVEETAPVERPYTTPEVLADAEPPEEVKALVKARDGHRCLCCGDTRFLQVDHIEPRHYGGGHEVENLQTLCRKCNADKGTATIDFRGHRPMKRSAATERPDPAKPSASTSMEGWARYVRRCVNFRFGCAAVKDIEMNERANSWTVVLHPRLNPGSVFSYLMVVTDHVNTGRRAKRLKPLRLEVRGSDPA